MNATRSIKQQLPESPELINVPQIKLYVCMSLMYFSKHSQLHYLLLPWALHLLPLSFFYFSDRHEAARAGSCRVGSSCHKGIAFVGGAVLFFFFLIFGLFFLTQSMQPANRQKVCYQLRACPSGTLRCGGRNSAGTDGFAVCCPEGWLLQHVLRNSCC